MSYLGVQTLKDAEIKRGSATGNGSTTAYAIGWTPPSEQSMFITINGVTQHDAAYTISGSTLTFAAAPASADAIEWRGIQSSGTVITPGDGTLGEAKIADGAVVVAKIGDNAVTGAKIAMGSDAAGDILTYTGTDYVRLAKGTATQALVMNAGATAVEWGAAGLFSSYALIADQKASRTRAGTATGGSTWRTRDLNTELADPDSIVSIASNRFTLAAGSYFITWQCPFYRTNYTKTRLYDYTNSTAIQVGVGGYTTNTGDRAEQTMWINGHSRATPSGSTVYEIQYECQTTQADYGLGESDQTGADVELYTTVEIFKEA